MVRVAMGVTVSVPAPMTDLLDQFSDMVHELVEILQVVLQVAHVIDPVQMVREFVDMLGLLTNLRGVAEQIAVSG